MDTHDIDSGVQGDDSSASRVTSGRVEPATDSFLEALRRFDPDAQLELYEYYFGRIVAWLISKYPRASREDLIDCAHMALYKALTKAQGFRGNSRLKTWLYRIAINEVLTTIRKLGQGATLIPIKEYLALDANASLPSIISRIATPFEEVAETQRLANIQAVFQRLEPHLLCIVEMERAGLTNQQIARELGGPVKAVEARKAGIRRALKAIIQDLGLRRDDLL
jgi:RNA polymerase sigma-70 factor (ECF subfamily)